MHGPVDDAALDVLDAQHVVVARAPAERPEAGALQREEEEEDREERLGVESRMRPSLLAAPRPPVERWCYAETTLPTCWRTVASVRPDTPQHAATRLRFSGGASSKAFAFATAFMSWVRSFAFSQANLARLAFSCERVPLGWSLRCCMSRSSDMSGGTGVAMPAKFAKVRAKV